MLMSSLGKEREGKKQVKIGTRALAFMNVLAYHLLLDAVTDVKFPAVSRVRRRVANMPKMPVALVTSVPEKG